MPGVIGRPEADDEQAEREALWEARALDRAKSRKPRSGEFGLWLPDGSAAMSTTRVIIDDLERVYKNMSLVMQTQVAPIVAPLLFILRDLNDRIESLERKARARDASD
jgi:hypothetical protein